MKLRSKKTGEVGLFTSGTDDYEVVFGVSKDLDLLFGGEK